MAINLEKGGRINLSKTESGKSVSTVFMGVNWGAIVHKSFFGSKTEAVDLDASCLVYDSNKNLIDTIYFGKLTSSDGAIRHSGDDLTGDVDGDDGLDNEIIKVEMNKLSSRAQSLVFILNSFCHQKFDEIPFASVRIYTNDSGNPMDVKEVMAKYDVANGPEFKGKEAIVLGVSYKKDGEWRFKAVGHMSNQPSIKDIARNDVPQLL